MDTKEIANIVVVELKTLRFTYFFPFTFFKECFRWKITFIKVRESQNLGSFADVSGLFSSEVMHESFLMFITS